MNRDIRFSEKLLLAGFSIILLFMVLHDWVPLGTLNDVHTIAQARTFNHLLIVTMIGVVQILLLMGLVIVFMGKWYPIWVKLWLIIHQASIFTGALIDWWIPYFFGYGAEQRVNDYSQMFGNTHSFLPVKNGIVPKTIHSIFHATLLICLILTVYITLTQSKRINKDVFLKA